MQYVEGNLETVRSRLTTEIDGIRVERLEGTYLAWIDFSRTGLGNIHQSLLDAGIRLSDGPSFGEGGKGFQRMNLAAPRSTVEEGIDGIISTIKNR